MADLNHSRPKGLVGLEDPPCLRKPLNRREFLSIAAYVASIGASAVATIMRARAWARNAGQWHGRCAATTHAWRT